MNNSNNQLSPAQEHELVRRFRKNARKQLHELKRTYKAASRSDDAEAVHDLRVATRRLQTILDLAACSDSKKDAGQLKKKLKKLRHTLSVKRDTDVLTRTMRSRAAGAASAARRRLWNQAARETRAEGERAARESRRWLRGQKLSELVSGIRKIVNDRINDGFSSRDLANRRASHPAEMEASCPANLDWRRFIENP
jgi:CHAD domain-containing protein